MGGTASSEGGELPPRYFQDLRASIPAMTGKTVAITGPSIGSLGFICAQVLAEQGAQVLLLNSPLGHDEGSLERLRNLVPTAVFQPIVCDLQSFASVRVAVNSVNALCPDGLDALVCAAELMAAEDKASVDGFDVQMQTNHLGHFLLVHGLFPRLEVAQHHRGDARVVIRTSLKRAQPFYPLLREYLQPNGGKLGGNGSGMFMNGARWIRYQQSQLASGLFASALHDKLVERQSHVKVILCHPGLCFNNRGEPTTGLSGKQRFWLKKLGQSPEDAALSLLKATTDPRAVSGDFFGPMIGIVTGFHGPAARLEVEDLLLDPLSMSLLWTESSKAVGIDGCEYFNTKPESFAPPSEPPQAPDHTA